MFKYTKSDVIKIARENEFIVNNTEKLDVEELKEFVSNKIKEMFYLDDDEKEFIKKINMGVYDQKLLFANLINTDLSGHPMVIWKLRNNSN